MTSKDKTKVSENNLYILGPKSDFNEWSKRLESRVVTQQVKYVKKWLKSYLEAREKASKDGKSEDSVRKPFKFPHTWESFMFSDPVMPEALQEIEQLQYKQAYAYIHAKYVEWWAECLPEVFLGTLKDSLHKYKVHDILERLKVMLGNNNGVSLVKKIMDSIRVATKDFKNVKTFLALIEQKGNQADALAMQLLGRELTFRDVLLAAVLEASPAETWGTKFGLTNEDFKFEVVKAFVENTYQTKSYSDIHHGQKRSNEI